MRTHIIAALIALGSTGCVGLEPLSVIGDQCDLNTDCQAPYICALGRCRTECEVSRDCALGLRCLLLQEPTLGVCQLPDETSCTLPSDCPAPLACFENGGCLVACVTDDDCVAGEMCESGECVAPDVVLCVYNSDCDYPNVCRREQCVRECSDSIDCARDEACVPHGRCSVEDVVSACMCRVDCSTNPGACPLGTDCVECTDAACGGVTAFCERPTSTE